MAQQQTKPAKALDKVDPVWTRIRDEAEDIVAARAGARHLHLFLDPAPRHARDRGGAPRRRAARPCRRLGRADPAGLCRRARGRADARRRVPRRHRRDLRPRSGDRPLHRAGALLQGLPRHPDPPAGALAVEQGPQGFRLLPAEPLLGGVPVRHPSGRPHRPRHLPRSRHRPRGRRDRGDRRRRVDAARRDARRHRQGARRPPSQDPPTAC